MDWRLDHLIEETALVDDLEIQKNVLKKTELLENRLMQKKTFIVTYTTI